MTGVSPETADEYDVLEPARQRTVSFRGEDVEVRPLTVGQLPRFARALRPMIGPLNEVLRAEAFAPEQVISLIEDYGEAAAAAAAAGIDRPPEFVAGGALDEFTELALAVMAVNLDFFVQRLLPRLAGKVNDLVDHLRAIDGSGRIPSSSSSVKATH